LARKESQKEFIFFSLAELYSAIQKAIALRSGAISAPLLLVNKLQSSLA